MTPRVLLSVAFCLGCAEGGGDQTSSPSTDATTDTSAVADSGASDSGDAVLEASTDTASDVFDAGPPLPLQMKNLGAGLQIYPGGGYRYGPSIAINGDGSVEMWTCSPGADGAWDYVRHRHSTDGGKTWSADTVAIAPTKGSRDAFSACDPGAVKIGTYWYVGYTSTEDSRGTANHLYVARSTNAAGPFEKWNGTGWGGNPQPIVTYKGDASKYGIGEPSMVVVKDKLYVFYSYVDAQGFTDLSLADATRADWPATLVDKGHVITRRANAEDSTDLKWVDSLNRFVGVTTYDRFSDASTIGVYQSFDGLSFEPVSFQGPRVQPGAHNVGISGTPEGHLDTTKPNFIAYAYQPPGKSWGDWPTYLDPITLGPTSPGAAVGGAVSTYLDWSWSGPKAWDGDPGTVWSSKSHGGTADAAESIAIDLGRLTAVKGIRIVPRATGLAFPVDFTIQTSETGATWTDVVSKTAFANPGSTPVELPFTASARWLRLSASKLGADDFGNHYLQLAEVSALLP